MRKYSDANLLNNKLDDCDALVVAPGNSYAVATGVTDIAPSEDEYANQIADLIAQKVLGALLPTIGTAQKIERTSVSSALAANKAEQLLTDNEVAALFKVSKQTIWRWIKTSEDFPKPLKVEKGSTRWRLSEVVAYEARMAAER